jgi:bud site selection protein 20
MSRVRHKRTHKEKRAEYRAHRTRRRTRDLDQIHEDLKEKEKYLNQALNEELPGLGQFYCIECAKHYISADALSTHQSSKVHKKRHVTDYAIM